MFIRNFNQSKTSKDRHYSYDSHKGRIFRVVLNIYSFKVSKIYGMILWEIRSYGFVSGQSETRNFRFAAV